MGTLTTETIISALAKQIRLALEDLQAGTSIEFIAKSLATAIVESEVQLKSLISN
jgi:hypothetical protein